MKILIATKYPSHRKYMNDMLAAAIRNLAPNIEVECTYTNLKSYKAVLPKLRKTHYDYLFVWNGSEAADIGPLRTAKGLTNVIYFEVGWFPGRPICTMYADPSGINADASIRKTSIIGFGDHTEEVAEIRKRLTEKYAPMYPDSTCHTRDLGTGFIFVPLQLPTNTNIVRHSNFKSMREFIPFCKRMFPHSKVVFKKHPEDDRTYGSDVLSSGNINDLLWRCKAVVGINSTVLVEALIHNRPVASVGKGLLTGLGVHLECHENYARLPHLIHSNWQPDKAVVDEVIYELYTNRQLSLEFPGALERSLKRNRVLSPILMSGGMKVEEPSIADCGDAEDNSSAV